jgi:tRNA pseudouridine55 synthase
MEPKTVTIHSIDLLHYHYPELQIRVKCGSGTYIRSLARDIGEKLETGAYLKALTRTAVGDFAIQDALHLESGDV